MFSIITNALGSKVAILGLSYSIFTWIAIAAFLITIVAYARYLHVQFIYNQLRMGSGTCSSPVSADSIPNPAEDNNAPEKTESATAEKAEPKDTTVKDTVVRDTVENEMEPPSQNPETLNDTPNATSTPKRPESPTKDPETPPATPILTRRTPPSTPTSSPMRVGKPDFVAKLHEDTGFNL